MKFVQSNQSNQDIEIIPSQLKKGKIAKIRYNGPAAQEGQDVWAHVGYSNGENWESIRQIKMIPTGQGYEAIVPMKDYQKFNVVFTNDFIYWDNNQGKNYSFPILSEQ